jgi:hypothetical protein
MPATLRECGDARTVYPRVVAVGEVDPGEEVVVPTPVTMASRFRSSWLTTSVRAMKTRGLTERYLELLPPSFHDAVLHSEAGVWLPVDVATAHYTAMNALGLSEGEAVRIGAEVAERTQGIVIATMLRLARSVGVTPWAVLGQSTRVYDKSWVGGGMGVFRAGPREARVVVAGWPFAHVAYTQHGLRGILLAAITPFCARALAQPVPKHTTGTQICVRLQWV